MFCYQCQETAKNVGCTVVGVCGKTSTVANMQDLLMFVMKGISVYSTAARQKGHEDAEVNKFIFDGLFATITNANFDYDVFVARVRKGLELRQQIKEAAEKLGAELPSPLPEAATWHADSEEAFVEKSTEIGVLSTENEDVRSLRELVTYGLKGLAAYTEHAYNLDEENPELYAFMQRALVATTNDNLTVDELVALTLETGKYGVEAMALLDKANTGRYGNPEITKVNIGVRNNPAILISGHDMRDMEDLLKQTEGTGVDVYTHSEMLPANYYPAFKKYEHFVGNYGSSWWKQNEEFEKFNGPVLFTTNCIVPQRKSNTYADRIYTTGASGYPGFQHIGERPAGGMK
ncbi:MAG: hydroxylamine reductase, partial [Bacteroidales bacterium]|nr:hydroxylamine reductase [Bacteroidales bacterium]